MKAIEFMDYRIGLTMTLMLFVLINQPDIVSGLESQFLVHEDSGTRTEQLRGSDHFPNDLSRNDARGIRQADPKEIFLQAIDIISQFYVRDVSVRSLLESVWKRLQFMVLPECTEGVGSLGDCEGSVEKCFLDMINEICQTCHLDCSNLLTKSIALLVTSLDPNSSFLDQGMMNELKISTSGKFGGVGMVVSSRDDYYVVVSALDGSPAQKAGIKAGDTILEIDGHRLQGLPLPSVLAMVRGASGSMISVLVENSRNKKLRRINMRRQMIRIAPVRTIMLSGRIGYIRIVNFQENTSKELIRALFKLTGNNQRMLHGIIIDVRDNPGGLFEEAIKVAGLFKASSKLTSLKGRNPDVTRDFLSPLNTPIYEGPIIVLASKGSASGSEILAGALQGMPNVKVIGERTFGKASVQAIFPLSPTMALRLTTAHYYTADGRDIEGRGIDPDISLNGASDHSSPRIGTLNAADLEADPVIKIALEYLLYGRLPLRSPFQSLF